MFYPLNQDQTNLKISELQHQSDFPLSVVEELHWKQKVDGVIQQVQVRNMI